MVFLACLVYLIVLFYAIVNPNSFTIDHMPVNVFTRLALFAIGFPLMGAILWLLGWIFMGIGNFLTLPIQTLFH